MPQPGERYNRFMKFCMPAYSNDNAEFIDNLWESQCQVCGKTENRGKMKYKEGLVRCQTCLKKMTVS